MDKALEKRRARAERAKVVIRERRRFNVAQPPTGRLAAPVDADVTRFPKTVREPQPGDDVLTDCINQVKIGGRVTVGDFRGRRVYGLTLEERVTCPRTCQHWRTCYGNHMPFATRWEHGDALERELERQIRELIVDGPLLVRLHLLGDFYSWQYLRLWAEMLDRWPGLAAFGFTAHLPGTKLGDGIARLREVYPNRFAIRHSGITGRWGCATIDFPTEKKFIGDAVVCPEQLDAMRDEPKGRHCGNCAVCWQTDRPVIFIEHGG